MAEKETKKTNTTKSSTAKKTTTKKTTAKKTTTKKTTTAKKVSPKKEVVQDLNLKEETAKEEKITVEEPIKEEEKDSNQNNENVKETMMGISRNAELVLVYILSILGFVFSLMKDDKISEEMRFHYNQAGTLFIISSCISIITSVFSETFTILSLATVSISIALFVLTIIALVKACDGEKYEIPVINDLSNSIWK